MKMKEEQELIKEGRKVPQDEQKKRVVRRDIFETSADNQAIPHNGQ